MSAVMREIRLYGRLGRQFGRVFHLAVQSPGEAVRALSAVLPGFREAFLGQDGRAEYYVYVGRGLERAVIDAAQKDDLVGARAPIRIVPAVGGAKKQGAGQTIMGAVLLVVGVIVGVVGGLTYNPALMNAGIAIGNAGLAMMIGGVVQMLSPQRKPTDKTGQNSPSYGMDGGAINNIDAGMPVPLAYGRIVCGSVQISGGLSTDEIVTGYDDGGGGGLEPTSLPNYMSLSVVDSGAAFSRQWAENEHY